MSKHNIQVGVLTLGMVATNCYFVFDADNTDENGKKHAIVFDPADAGAKIYDELSKNDIVVDLILFPELSVLFLQSPDGIDHEIILVIA